MAKGTPQDYGSFSLDSARLLTLPQLTESGIDWFGEPPQERLLGANGNGNGDGNGNGGGGVKRMRDTTQPTQMKRPKVDRGPQPPPPVPPPPPPISSVGVMDIGQGNCNVLIDQNHQPVTYYDVGYPLYFFLSALPNNMRFGNPAYLGPYQPNSCPNMNVVLSHWDWDHWRLGLVANLTNLQWTIPNQPTGPATINFLHALGGNAHVYPAATPFVATANYTIYKCTPLPGMPPASLMNNSGVAVGLYTRFPNAPALPNPNWHRVMLTADANFNTVAGVVNPANPAFPDLAGITAVHHGSVHYGAPNNLPAPDATFAAQGRLAYSYGVSAASGNHPYGFPGTVAVTNYTNAGWVQQRSTAEGPTIHSLPTPPPLPPPPPAVRGNVRMGDQTALAFPNTAFTTFPAPCQLP